MSLISEMPQNPDPPPELVAAVKSMLVPGSVLILSDVIGVLTTCHRALLESLNITISEDDDLRTLVAQVIDGINPASGRTVFFMTTVPPAPIEDLINTIDNDLTNAESWLIALLGENPHLTTNDLLRSPKYNGFRAAIERMFPYDQIDELEELIRTLAAKHLSS